MAEPIKNSQGTGFSPLQPIPPLSRMSPGQEVPQKDFKSIFVESLNEVNRLQKEADEGVTKLLTGETQNVAEVLAAADKAGVAFDLLMEVRNKLTEAY